MSEPQQAGERGAGGYHSVWPETFPDAPVAHRIEFQYADMQHQAETAVSGMWLFLATEILFFGGLFLLYAIYRAQHPLGMAQASGRADLAIGTINTVILLTSSAVFSYGFGCARLGRNRSLFRASLLTAFLGCAFLALKAYEWTDDIGKHLFPGADFALSGLHAQGAQMFWCLYFIATGIHGLHMIAGIGLVGWIAMQARAGSFSARYATPVEVVGLYWSFVDMIWLILYPAIYLAGRVS